MLMDADVLPQGALWVAMVVPASIAFPTGFLFEAQKRELLKAHSALANAHSELSMAHDAVVERSRHDFLTGLFNREHFFRCMRKRRRDSSFGTLMVVDADRFKLVNDTWGHAAGDEALKLIAATLKQNIREEDLVARIGGEEFAIYLDQVSTQEAHIFTKKLLEGVSEVDFYPDEGVSHQLTVSIGGADLRAGEGVSEAMARADSRLYEAKNSGRNCSVLFDTDASVTDIRRPASAG